MPKKLTILEVEELVSSKDGCLLSNKYKNVQTRLKVKCNKCQEIFLISVKKIKNGKWCVFCNISKPQKQLYYIFKELYPKYTIKNNYTRFAWLKTSSGGKQEIDIFVYNKEKTFTLAVEYDGEQHFKTVNFGKESEEKIKQNLIKTQKLDALKNKKIAAHKEDIKYFIRFNYKDDLSKENIVKKLAENEIPIDE